MLYYHFYFEDEYSPFTACAALSIYLSILFHLSRAKSLGQQLKQTSPNIPLPSHPL